MRHVQVPPVVGARLAFLDTGSGDEVGAGVLDGDGLGDGGSLGRRLGNSRQAVRGLDRCSVGVGARGGPKPMRSPPGCTVRGSDSRPVRRRIGGAFIALVGVGVLPCDLPAGIPVDVYVKRAPKCTLDGPLHCGDPAAKIVVLHPRHTTHPALSRFWRAGRTSCCTPCPRCRWSPTLVEFIRFVGQVGAWQS